MGIIGAAIKSKLTDKFNPSQLEVKDESHKHAHHRGAREHAADGGSAESHFHVIIVSQAFEGLNRLARHRTVMEALSEEMPKIHAFSLDARSG